MVANDFSEKCVRYTYLLGPQYLASDWSRTHFFLPPDGGGFLVPYGVFLKAGGLPHALILPLSTRGGICSMRHSH